MNINKYKYCDQKMMTEVLLTSSEKFSSTTPSKRLCPSMPLANWLTLSGSSRKILAASKNVSLNLKSLPVLTPLEFRNLMNFKVYLTKLNPYRPQLWMWQQWLLVYKFKSWQEKFFMNPSNFRKSFFINFANC